MNHLGKIHKQKRRGLLLRLLGAALLVFGVFGHIGESEARLDPFYIVHGQSYGKLKPRILFVVDSSSTMRFAQPWPDVGCDWGECENWNPDQSRVHAARYVINQVTAAASDEADFGLMTFGQAKPPSSAALVPEPCSSLDMSEQHRFMWVTDSDAPGYMQKIGGKWQLVPQSSEVINPFGSQGSWMLCGDNRLFPYLRHDDLGAFSMPDDSNAALSDEPLYKAEGSEAGFFDPVNYERKVQWMPRYIGRRGNLDCGDQNEEAIAQGSYGDYGNTDAERSAEVCGRDFYFWPYVDGFTGYSWHTVTGPDALWEQECDNDGNCVMQNDTAHRGGVSRRDSSVGASLFAPFYSESVLAAADIPPEDKGPLTQEDAALIFGGMTSKVWEGGVDVSGGKPFIEVIGDLDNYLNFNGGVPEPGAGLVKSNAQFAHDDVASYLAFVSTVTEEDICRPQAVIFLTDAMPTDYKPGQNKEMYTRLRKFRAKLGVRTYAVGFSNEWWNNGTAWDGLNLFACAANGATNTAIPCGGGSPFEWDTCEDPDDPKNACAYRVATADDLSAVLSDIIGQIIETAVPAGSPTVANDFVSTNNDDPDATTSVQTNIEAWTDVPGWFGHVARGACTDEDPDNPGQLADYCQNAADLPVDTPAVETFGVCPLSRVWDAGECLAQTDWTDRRIYTHDYDNNVIRISTNAGKPTGEFEALVEQLNSEGKIDPPLTPGNESEEIEAMVEFLLGSGLPDDWKLPGIANSAPILIRRVPEQDENFLPSVGIADPHCAGRRNVVGDDVPDSLKEFSTNAWELSTDGFSDHYEYVEAVLVGDDFGLLHSFHYNSGNELFGFLPLALINNSRVLSVNGVDNFGQPEELDEHVFGVASTVNAGWAYDELAETWRHLAVFGLGPGGSEILTIDVSHMARLLEDSPLDQENKPVEVLWSTSTASIAQDYADTLGETWSRPALTYAVPNHQMVLEPKAYMVFGSGYRNEAGEPERGRVVWMVDALTGETITKKAYAAAPADGAFYDLEDDMAEVSDVAVGSHCLSRYWGEMQEAYWADPAGRLFRWDLATETSDVESFPHEADSEGPWETNPQGFTIAEEAFRFPACQGLADYDCDINPIGTNKGDVFTYSPSVAAKNRIDPINDGGEILGIGDRDQFLIALNSGSPNDDVIDGGVDTNDFHSSIYLLVDDHREDPAKGFDIPVNAPATAPGAHPSFMRLPLNQIERTRHIVFPDGTEDDETAYFSKSARPIRAPMMRVTGVVEDGEQVPVEVFYVTYTIYEPAQSVCDPRWYDEDAGEWVFDPGATYEISFRLATEIGEGFDFTAGYQLGDDPGDGFGTDGGLSGPRVDQVTDCGEDNCGVSLSAPSSAPCDPNQNAPGVGGAISVQTGGSELQGFSPLEIPL